MRDFIEIENIEAMRLQEGIEDVELREDIRGLHVGDSVKLTFLASSPTPTGETLPVRITRIEGKRFRGKLARRPASSSLSNLEVGSALTFTTAHIHSLAKKRGSP